MIDTTIVIPTKNRLDFLKRCLESIACQDIKPKEIIIVDDCSENIDYESLDLFRSQLSIQIIRNSSSIGGAAARNAGVASAKTAFITFLDDDDCIEPGFLRHIQSQIDASDGDLFYSSKKFLLYPSMRQLKKTSIAKNVIDGAAMIRGNAVGSTSCVTGKKSVFESNGFDEALPALQDYELWLRLTTKGFGFFPVSNAFMLYTINTAGSQISGKYEKHEFAYQHIVEKYKNLIPNDDFSTLKSSLLLMGLKAKHRHKYLAVLLASSKAFLETKRPAFFRFLVPYQIYKLFGLYSS